MVFLERFERFERGLQLVRRTGGVAVGVQGGG